MKNIYKVEFSDAALEGFQHIVNYIESTFSDKDAQKFIIKFDEIIHLMAQNPRAFAKIGQIKNVRRALVAKLTSIYFGVNDDTKIIYVYFIKDNRQQQPDFL